MAEDAGSYGKIDWGSAAVGVGTLTLPLTGEPSSEWSEHLSGVIARLKHEGAGWGSIKVTRQHVEVGAVRDGADPEMRRVLELAVMQTNAAFSTDGLVLGTRQEDRMHTGSVGGSLLLIALALIAVAVQATSWTVPVRPIVVVTFITFGPGWAILRLWGLASGWAGLALVIAVSLSLAMIVSGAMLYAGVWSPFASLVVLAGLTVATSSLALGAVIDGREIPSDRRLAILGRYQR